jgi:putative acetyltransferase
VIEIAAEPPHTADVHALIALHHAASTAISPPGLDFVLSPEALAQPGITLFTARADGVLLAIAALGDLAPGHAEVKSMRTAPAALRRGAGRALLVHLLAVARARGLARISLETGNTADFAAARALYEAHGFARCGPFGQYPDSAFNIYYTQEL